jgi:hypothetical protein
MEARGQFHCPTALPLGMEKLYPLDSRLGGPQSRPGLYGEEKISYPCRESKSVLPAPNLVLISSELSWILHKALFALNVYNVTDMPLRISRPSFRMRLPNQWKDADIIWYQKSSAKFLSGGKIGSNQFHLHEAETQNYRLYQKVFAQNTSGMKYRCH